MERSIIWSCSPSSSEFWPELVALYIDCMDWFIMFVSCREHFQNTAQYSCLHTSYTAHTTRGNIFHRIERPQASLLSLDHFIAENHPTSLIFSVSSIVCSQSFILLANKKTLLQVSVLPKNVKESSNYSWKAWNASSGYFFA